MSVVVGLFGGSGLLKSSLPALQNLTEELVDTPHGRVFLRTGPLPGGATLVFVQRHDARSSRSYTQPADINYPAIALALKAKVRPTHAPSRSDSRAIRAHPAPNTSPRAAILSSPSAPWVA